MTLALTAPTTLAPPLAIHRPTRSPAAVYLSGLSVGSVPTMRRAMQTVTQIMTGATRDTDGRWVGGDSDVETFPWHELRHEHVSAIRARLCEHYAAGTTNRHLATVRGVMRSAWRLGLMSAEDFHRACDIPAVRGESLPRGRSLDAGELRSLFSICADDPTPAGRRDAAILAVCAGCGLRRAEVVALDLADFDAETGQVTVRSGKGNKSRLCYAANGAGVAIKAWLSARGLAPGALFQPISQTGEIHDRPMTSQAVYAMLEKRAQQASVSHFSPHDLRRTFVGDMLDAGADISLVQQLAGHANVTTTQRYDKRPERAKRTAAGLLHVPYVAPKAA